MSNKVDDIALDAVSACILSITRTMIAAIGVCRVRRTLPPILVVSTLSSGIIINVAELLQLWWSINTLARCFVRLSLPPAPMRNLRMPVEVGATGATESSAAL